MALPSWIFRWPPESLDAAADSGLCPSPPDKVPSGIEAITVALLASVSPRPEIRELLRDSRSKGVFTLISIMCVQDQCSTRMDIAAGVSTGTTRAAIERIAAVDIVTISEVAVSKMYGPAALVDLHSMAQLWLGLGARLMIITLASGGVAVFKPTAGSGKYNPNVIGGGVTNTYTSEVGSYPGWEFELLRQLRDSRARHRLQRDDLASMSSNELHSAVDRSLLQEQPLWWLKSRSKL